MRSPVCSWDNRNERRIGKRRTYNGWTRRVTWYADSESIRLKFEDEAGVYNKIYREENRKELAEKDFQAFKRGDSVHAGGRDTLKVNNEQAGTDGSGSESTPSG